MSAGRRTSRQVALQVLYAADLAGRGEGGPTPERIEAAFESVGGHFELPEGARAFAKELVTGVAAHRDRIDALLAAHATHWRLERMAAVDRNLLRLAIYEMAWGGTPSSVAIDEAVDLARRFGSDRSSAFVNGVLDAVARALAEEGPAAERAEAEEGS